MKPLGYQNKDRGVDTPGWEKELCCGLERACVDGAEGHSDHGEEIGRRHILPWACCRFASLT